MHAGLASYTTQEHSTAASQSRAPDQAAGSTRSSPAVASAAIVIPILSRSFAYVKCTSEVHTGSVVSPRKPTSSALWGVLAESGSLATSNGAGYRLPQGTALVEGVSLCQVYVRSTPCSSWVSRSISTIASDVMSNVRQKYSLYSERCRSSSTTASSCGKCCCAIKSSSAVHSVGRNTGRVSSNCCVIARNVWVARSSARSL